MLKREKSNIKRSWIHTSVACLLLTLMSVYLISVSTFTHTHIVDGVKIVHSHPFKNSQHKHSAPQLVLFQSLSQYNFIVPDSFYVDFKQPQSSCVSVFTEYKISYHSPFSGSIASLRAPPAYC